MEEDLDALIDDLPAYNVIGSSNVAPRIVSDCSLDGLQEEKIKLENISLHRKPTTLNHTHLSLDRNGSTNKTIRLNKFVRRLHDMLVAEKTGKIVEWRRGLLVLHNIDEFANNVLPKYFNTRNYKTFRRQLNYYGFQHVRSFSGTEGKDGISSSTTTALWVHQGLADHGTDQISSVLKLKRADRGEASSSSLPKTPQDRRERKHEAASSILAKPMTSSGCSSESMPAHCDDGSTIPKVVHYRQQEHPSTFMPHEAPAVSSFRYDTIEQAAPELLLSMKRK